MSPFSLFWLYFDVFLIKIVHNNFKLIFIPIILTLFSIYYDYNLILLNILMVF